MRLFDTGAKVDAKKLKALLDELGPLQQELEAIPEPDGRDPWVRKVAPPSKLFIGQAVLLQGSGRVLQDPPSVAALIQAHLRVREKDFVALQSHLWMQQSKAKTSP